MLHKLTAERLSLAQQEQLISSTLKEVLEYSQPTRVILFGSAASRTMTTASDIDLVAVYADEPAREQARTNLFCTARRDTWPRDLLLYTKATFLTAVASGGGAAWAAAQDGKVLFDSDPVQP